MNILSGGWAVADTEIERNSKTTFESCKTNCIQDVKCNAMYYLNGFCFIVYNKNPARSSYAGSSYLSKVCNHTYGKFLLLSFKFIHNV